MTENLYLGIDWSEFQEHKDALYAEADALKEMQHEQNLLLFKAELNGD